MNRPLLKMSLLIALVLSSAGCTSSFWGGTGTGVLGAGAGYEYNANRQMKRIEADLKAGNIDQKEYDIRKDQIKRDSLLQ